VVQSARSGAKLGSFCKNSRNTKPLAAFPFADADVHADHADEQVPDSRIIGFVLQNLFARVQARSDVDWRLTVSLEGEYDTGTVEPSHVSGIWWAGNGIPARQAGDARCLSSTKSVSLTSSSRKPSPRRLWIPRYPEF
jgi:hypothetical protein